MGSPQRLVPAVQVIAVAAQPRQRVADEAPLLEIRTAHEGDAQSLRDEPGPADQEEHNQDDRVLGLALDANAVGANDVAPHECPRDTDQEDDAGGITDEGVRLVRLAVEELPSLR